LIYGITKQARALVLQSAFEWLLPYALGEKKWTYQQIEPYDVSGFYPLLLQAANKFHNENYLKKTSQLNSEDKDAVAELLYR
jgi:hypothetical protein